MLKKLSSFACALTFLATFAYANETADSQNENSDQCELSYSACMNSCESQEGEALETCYDKCDETYSNCLEKIQSN